MSEPKTDIVNPALPATPSGSDALRDLTTGSAGTLILLLLVFACYAWSSQSGYIWDDDAYVVNNPTLKSFAGLSRIWTEVGATPQFYPLTFTTFWVEHQLWGLRPGLSHIVNALLHAGSVLMLWQILRRLSVPGAWAAAAVFAVHPINVESVAWISERKNTLSLLLMLSATWIYLRYARIGVETKAAPAGEGIKVALPDDPSRLYRLFLVLFVLALLSKTVVAVLPVMLAVIVWWQCGRLTKADLLPLALPLLLGAAGGAVTSYVEHSPNFVGASGVEWDVPLIHRVMLLGQTTAFYAYKLLWPFALWHYGDVVVSSVPFFPISFNYERWSVNPKSVLQWLPLLGLIGTLGLLARRATHGRRGALAAVLLFIIGLLPASGLFTFFPMRFSWVADHFAYVGSVGLIVGVVAGLAVLLRRVPVVAAGVTGVALAGMVAVTFWHATAFKNLESLWTRTLVQNPRSWMAAVNFATVLMEKANTESALLSKQGDDEAAAKQRNKYRDAAEQWLTQSIKLNPNGYEAYRTLGVLALQNGKPDDALASFRRSEAVASELRATGYRQPAFDIGYLLLAQGKIEEGLAVFEKLQALPASLRRRNGNLFAQMRTRHGDILRQRISGPIQPNDMSQADRDLLSAAIDQYSLATEEGPDYIPPKLRLARIMIDITRERDALTQIGDVLSLDPRNPEAKLLTAQIAQKQGLYDAAASQLANLLSLYPNYLTAHLEFAKVLRTMNRLPEAVVELKRTLTLFPGQPDAERMLAEIEGRPTTIPSTAPSTTQAN